MTLSYLEELGLIQQFSDEAAEVERRAAAVTPEDAERLTRAYTTNPYLNRQIMASLALAGMPEDKIRQIGDYATSKMVNVGITPYPDDRMEYIPQNQARQLIENISIQIPGYGGSAMTPIGVGPSWIGETWNDLSSSVIDGYQALWDSLPDAATSTITEAGKGFIRTGITIGESTGQFAQNRISQAIQYADSKGYQWWDLRYTLDALSHIGMLNEDSRQGVIDAAKATDVGIAIQQYRDTGRVDLGSGYFPAGTVDEQQAAMQREVLGTLPGPGGQEYAYTPGRRIAKEFVDVGVMSHDNIVAQSISGLIDGSIKAVADATNLIGGTKIGRTAVAGAKMPRNAATYNRLASEARQMAAAGNDAQAVLKMRQAQEAIGIPVGRLSNDEVIQLFDSTDEASVMLRGELLDRAGIIREGDTVTVNLPETAKWLSSGDGQRVLGLIAERDTAAGILNLFEDNIGPRLAKRLAETSDPVEIARILGAAYANPGSMLEDAVTMYPHVGVFNVRDKAATVRRAIGANAKAGKYLPPGSILNPQNPTQFIHDFKILANALPLGAGRDGFRRFDPRLVDEYVNRFVDAFDSGVPGAVVEVVGDFEKDLVAMFNRLGFTMEEAESITRWSANADRIGQYLMKDLAANNPTNVAESGIALYQDMLNSGIMVIDNDRLQQVLRSTGRAKQILRNNPATSSYARTSQRIDELSDKIDDLLEAGKTEKAAELAKTREALRKKQQRIVAQRVEGQGPKDLLYWLEASTEAADTARYYLKSSMIVRLAYITRVLPDEIGRVMASGAFDDVIDYFAAVGSGRYKFDAFGNEWLRTNKKWHETLDEIAELIEAQDVAVRGGDEALALRYTNEILEKEAEVERLAQAWDAQRNGINQVMIASDSRRGSELVMREATRRSHASGAERVVNRFSNSETEARQWATGLVQQIGRRSNDPVMSELARAMTGRQLVRNTSFEVNGVLGNLAEHVEAGRVANVEEGLAYWLFDGPGNEFWQKFVQTKEFTGTSYQVDSFDSVMLWVNQISDELAYLTGGRTDMQGIISAADLPSAYVYTKRTSSDPVPELFHGTSKAFDEGRLVDQSMYARGVETNLLGPGFYTTDAPDLAKQYTKKGRGKEPAVYNVQWVGENPPRILDLNQPLAQNPELQEVFRRVATPLGDATYLEIDVEAFDRLLEVIEQGTGYEAYRQLYEALDGNLSSDVFEIVADLQEDLREFGDVLLHEGGVRGGPKHNVYVWINEGDVEITRQIEDVPVGLPKNASRVAQYDEELVQAIATGRFRGRTMSELTRGNNIQTNPEAVRYVFDEFRQTANAPNNIIYRSRGAFGETPDNKYQQFVNFFFGQLYGVPSDVLARNPMFRRIYWNAMADLVRSTDQKTAATIVKNAQKANVSDKLMQKIIENSRLNLGDAPLENLDQLAKGRAIAEVKDLLFDASKRGAGADALRFVVLFGDAWKEVFQTYGRLLVNRRGKPALRVAQGIYAGTKATVGGPGDIYGVNPLTGEPTVHPDGRPESWFYKDPVSGDMIYTLPMSRDVISWAAGIPKSDAPALVAPLTGLNLAGSIFPGFGPIVDNIVNSFIPQTSRMRAIREFLFPYGEPASPETEAGRQTGFEMFVPGSLQKIATGLRDWQALGQVFNLLSQAESNVGYQNARNHVARLLMNVQLRELKNQQQEAGVAPEDVNNPMLVANQQAFFDEVNRVTDMIYLVRGFAQFLGPASPFLQWYASTDQGNVMVSLTVDEMNKAMDQYVEQGLSPDLAVSDMLDKYGVEVFMSATSLTESTLTGANSSDEWFDFYLDNKEFVDSYELVGAFFGPTGEFSNDARSSMISRGIYQVKSLEQQFEDAAFTLSYVAYNRERERYGPETSWSPQIAQYLAEYRAALENQFGIDMETFADRRRLQIGQLEQMLQDSFNGDPLAVEYMNSDLGIKIQEYLAYRQVVAVEAERRGTNWQGGANAADLREIMRELGTSLSENDPVFNRLYQFVFKGEMLREDVTPERPAIVPVR